MASLKLPTTAGEWGFVIVLVALFGGLAFGIIYSQVHLHDMRREQASRDTESNLLVLAEAVRQYQREHGRIEGKLTAMGVPEESLRTRHADFSDEVIVTSDKFSITATLFKFDQPTCTINFAPIGDGHEFVWSE